MDNWDAPSVALMSSIGNVRGNSYWEARLPQHQRIHPSVDDRTRAGFIKMKYLQRAWYAVPENTVVNGGGTTNGAASSSSSAATSAPAEVKVLSKMEQRQARLQARQQQAAAVAHPPAQATAAQASAIPHASAPIRQSSTPTTTTTTQQQQPAPTLFSGMNVPSAATKPGSNAHTHTHTHTAQQQQPKLPQKIHSASPWVTRDEHQQHHAQQPVVVQPAPVAATQHQQQPQPSVNILDFNQPTTQPPASTVSAGGGGGGVDDMFAGLSVADPSSSNAATSAGGNESLMNFYAHEPLSAPARSQHTGAFDFMQASDPTATVVPPPAIDSANGGASSFSFMLEDSSATSAPAPSDAFEFINSGDSNTVNNNGGVDMTSMPLLPLPMSMPISGMNGMPIDPSFDMNRLIVLPGGGAGMSVGGMNGGMPNMNGGGMNNLALPTNPSLSHSHSFPMVNGMNGNGMNHMNGGMNGGMNGMNGVGMNGMPNVSMGMTPNTLLYSQQLPMHLDPTMPLFNPYPGLAGTGNMMNVNMNGNMNGMNGGNYATMNPQQQSMLMHNQHLQQPAPAEAAAMQFTVHAVSPQQKSQSNQQSRSPARNPSASPDSSNDPFAHLSLTQLSPSAPLSTSPRAVAHGSPSSFQQPKQPHQCDIDGCIGTKVSRGLCAKHIRSDQNGAAVGAAAAVPSATAASSFEFLSAPSNSSSVASTTPPSSFSFLSSTPPISSSSLAQVDANGGGGSSSFAFI